MAQFEVVMPKMGESIEEATITNWFVKEGDTVEEDDVLLEIATDKVDSEIPSPVEGKVKKIMYQQDETVAVGSVIAIIAMGGEGEESEEQAEEQKEEAETYEKESLKKEGEYVSSDTPGTEDGHEKAAGQSAEPAEIAARSGDRFYSPLVRKIAEEENVSASELDQISGSGLNGRVQKKDILNYLESRKEGKKAAPEVAKPSGEAVQEKPAKEEAARPEQKPAATPPVSVSAEDEIREMDRMRKIIAEHMVRSKQVSAHVTNMLECDVTNIVQWRNKIKDDFMKREGVKITYLPVFLEAAARAIKDYPLINSSVNGNQIVIKKRINMGVAVALENNNLIVPVIKNIDNLSLTGITRELSRVASAARSNKLKPEDIQDGTFTVTNFGSFGNTIGTPIINQPQVAILAVGAIEKKPAVLETPQGDVIAIRHKMFLSLTYDHRIIDGSLGGTYLKRVADYIENFDTSRTF